jgi:WhiB family transcriptional regulator, redox-sensing transcriptional regulator
MALTAHRPARSVTSLVVDDPVELADDLPRLPRGVVLDLNVLQGAACRPEDLDLFYPEPDDQAAKALCATCPVRQPCLDMALATGDQHAILGGTTPAERGPLRRQRQVAYARQRAAQWATAATGIDPAEVRGPAGRSMRATCSATPAPRCGPGSCARPPGPPTPPYPLGLEVPNLHKPAELVHHPAKAREAFALIEQVGWGKATREVGVARRTLRVAFQQWGMGEPVHRGRGHQPGWRRTGRRCTTPGNGGAWNGRPTGPRVPGERLSGSWLPRAGPTPSGIPGGATARSGSGGHLNGQQSGRPDTNAEQRHP